MHLHLITFQCISNAFIAESLVSLVRRLSSKSLKLKVKKIIHMLKIILSHFRNSQQDEVLICGIKWSCVW
jgi:hypothetical protein